MAGSGENFGPDPFVGEQFEQDGVGNPAVNDVRLVDAARKGPEAGVHLGEHAPLDDARGLEAVNVVPVQGAHQSALLVQDSRHIGQEDEFLGPDGARDGAGRRVGVDVVDLAVIADAEGGDDGDEAASGEVEDDGGVHPADLADLAQVELGIGAVVARPAEGELGGRGEAGVRAREADRLAAVLVDEAHDTLVGRTGEDHLDDADGLLVGDPEALDELGGFSELGERIADLGAAAVDDDDVDADVFEQGDVLGKGGVKLLLHLGGAPVFDDDGLAGEALHVGQGLDKGGRSVFRVHFFTPRRRRAA